MRLLVLCREETSDVTGLREALRRRGVEVLVATPPDITVRCEGDRIDFELGRERLEPTAVFGWVSLFNREHGLWLLQAFERAGVPVLNGWEVLNAGQNKFLNSIILARAGLPHIPTVLVGTLEDAEREAERFGYPVVLKPVVGAKGHQVARVDDLNALRNLVPFYLEKHKAAYLQQHVSKPDRDIRVRVIDYRAVFAFYRYARPGELLTNLSAGGKWLECPLSPAMAALAEAAAKAFDARVAGVDLLEDGDTLRVIEVNTTPAITFPHMPTVDEVAAWILASMQPERQRGT